MGLVRGVVGHMLQTEHTLNEMCSESANSAKGLQCRRLVSDSVSYKMIIS